MEEKENVKETKRFNKTEKPAFKKSNKKPFKKGPVKTLDEIVLDTKAVVKVTKGGRQRRFQAVVLVGDKKGLVGLGIGKANEISEAVKKARQDANKNVTKISLINGRTIAHRVEQSEGASRVIINPAKAGVGLIAGGATRSVLDIAGVQDITAKILGSRNKINVARATIKALKSLKSLSKVAESREKTKEEILG